MSTLKLFLLGSPYIELDGATVSIHRRKALALLVYLAVTRESHSRETLATLFWPDFDERRARSNLRRAISAINSALGKGWLFVEPEQVVLEPSANVWLDVNHFRHLLVDCQADGNPTIQICTDSLASLSEAIDLYRADFLVGFTLPDCPAFDECCFFQAEGLRQSLATTLQIAAHCYSEQAEFETALQYARRWLAIDFLHEPAHRLLMQLYAQSGQKAAALRQYQECVRLLNEELGLTPEEKTTELLGAIKRGKLPNSDIYLISLKFERQKRDETSLSMHKKTLLNRLEAPTYSSLIGTLEQTDDLVTQLISLEPPWLISIEGMGGIGKTSLTDALIRKLIAENIVDEVGWVTARQQVFNLGGSIKPVNNPALTVDSLVEALVKQLLADDTVHLDAYSLLELRRMLQQRLKSYPHLIVIDNLETLSDVDGLLSTLRELANPTKFLLTSRASLYAEPDIYRFPVPELSSQNTLALVRQEAQKRNLPHLLAASDAELSLIYQTVGGNPLAIRLVVGQTAIHTLDVVLENLTQAQGKKVDNLYRYVYQRAWETLNELERTVFVAMPLVTNDGGTLDLLARVCQLDPSDVGDALSTLVRLSLVDSRGTLHERRYTVHNLTCAFLHEQVVEWE
ncbi:AAA family ATPase [Chloroflexi bacterium TSY]|nr:AAA family ATPase [Chloroflexi bacterium TSY]